VYEAYFEVANRVLEIKI